MNLKTKRLELTPITNKDLDVFHNTNTNPFVKKYLWDNQDIPKSVSIDILNKTETKFKTEKWGLWKIINLDNEEYMGYIGFWFFFDEKLPQLLYALLPEFTGNGYATEASHEIIDYAFKKLRFKHLIATMDKPNHNSVHVCKRLNMELIEERVINEKTTLFFKLENRNYN
ncbi:GNAT family N-acetyltransferase [Aquimarina megaterium]|uniref:GNAT family N-acetyltransferase n=1 Tax=Aquimarina megaterium TaxID=1443666 RepID=UPI00047149A5|nr:GNAT family N-acetyltransferase [Aquimarina megaterium]